jgi:hypothetical protein
MNATALKAKIDDAKRRLLTAETEMERALEQIQDVGRADKSIISSALSTALIEMKAARQDLLALEKVIAAGD